MDEPNLKCRVCWENKDKKICVKVTTKWAVDSLKTIKDVILLCVPWMTIKDKHFLCKPCLWQLKFTYDFIERCLKTENLLNEARNNGKGPVRLEDIFEKSLKRGNKIRIIFDNPVLSQTNTLNGADESIQEIVQDVNVNTVSTVQDYTEDNQNIAENINIKIQIPDKSLPSEHDYCINKSTEIYADLRENKENTSQVDLPRNRRSKKVLRQRGSNNPEKENIFSISDSECENNDESFFNESSLGDTIETIIIDSRENDIPAEKKNSKNICQENDTYDNSNLLNQSTNELTELLDIAAVDIWFVTAHSEMTAEQQNGLVQDGVNILNMSTDLNKKTRTIYLGRDLIRTGNSRCSRCEISFASRCDYLDHVHLHRRGKIKTPGEPIYTCEFCSETYTLDIEFRTHTRYLHGVSCPHKCTKCNRRFKTNKELENHIKTFKDKDSCIFKCKKCNKVFISRFRLKQHEEDVMDAPSCDYKKCRVCLQKFTKQDYRFHCTEVHPNYLCQECGKAFHESSNLLAHMNNVHQGKHCMCEQCGQILSHEKTLEHHIQSVHGEKQYMCDKCPRRFASKVYLKKHYMVHMEGRGTRGSLTEKKFKCEKCGKAYLRPDSLRLHERMHLGIMNFICPICNEGFLRKDYLKRHLNYHERFSKNTCPVCRKCFATEWRLVSHEFAGHDENGKSLETNQTKRPAKKRSDTHKYVCKICNKLLATKAILKNHYRAHLKLKAYKCNICDITCQTRVTLANHLKKHTDPNFEFSCNICHAQKSSNAELENHMFEVHKNKKYKCSLCPKTFGRKHLLASHETIDHKEENYKKEILLKALLQEEIVIPTDNEQSTKGVKTSRKGVKLGIVELDINKVFNELIQQNDSDVVPDGSPPRPSVGKNVVTLSNEYQSVEDARACRILEEEYISYSE